MSLPIEVCDFGILHLPFAIQTLLLKFEFKEYKGFPMTQDSTDQNFQTCLHKIIDYLSRRDHSEKELFEKLTKKKFTPDIIHKAINWARDHQYLRSPEELSQILTDQLLRRGKGRHYIYQYLKKRGLPSPSLEKIDKDTELRKALEFARQKTKGKSDLDRAAREKLGRQLVTRGFPLEVVRTILNEKLKLNDDNEYYEEL